MRLIELPPEVLDIAASFLVSSSPAAFPSPSQRNLVALRETCTLLASITARHLFRDVRFLQTDEVKFVKFCHVVVRFPRLAAHVHSLEAPLIIGDALGDRSGKLLMPAFKRVLHRALRKMTHLTELRLFLDKEDVQNLVQCQFTLRHLTVVSAANQDGVLLAQQPLLETLAYIQWGARGASGPPRLFPDSLRNLRTVSGMWPAISLVPYRPVTTCVARVLAVSSNTLRTHILPSLRLSAGPLEMLDIDVSPEDYAYSLMAILQSLPRLLHLTARTRDISIKEIASNIDNEDLWEMISETKPMLSRLVIYTNGADLAEGEPNPSAEVSAFTTRFVEYCPWLQKLEFRECDNPMEPSTVRACIVEVSRPPSADRATWSVRIETEL